MRIVIIMLLIALASFELAAQDIVTSTLGWKISYLRDVTTGEQLTLDNEQLVTYGSGKIEWQNADGSIKSTLQVNKVSGSWNNVSNTGYIIYAVSKDSKSGTVTFERSKNEIMIRILLVEGDSAPEIYELKIGTITQL